MEVNKILTLTNLHLTQIQVTRNEPRLKTKKTTIDIKRRTASISQRYSSLSFQAIHRQKRLFKNMKALASAKLDLAFSN